LINKHTKVNYLQHANLQATSNTNYANYMQILLKHATNIAHATVLHIAYLMHAKEMPL